MNNLFSSFDPRGIYGLRLNWVRRLLVLAILPPKFWLSKNSAILIISKILNYLHYEIKIAIGTFFYPGLTHLIIGLFMFILLNNFFGLIPYIFTSSSHLSFTVRLALPLWLGIIIFRIIKSINQVLAHLVPTGTPYPLMPFIVLIELVRNIIRPLTLSVRLAANMVAGHLLLVLIRTPMVSVSALIASIIFIGLFVLSLLELGVSFIQAYVFRTLISLYVGENSNPEMVYLV